MRARLQGKVLNGFDDADQLEFDQASLTAGGYAAGVLANCVEDRLRLKRDIRCWAMYGRNRGMRSSEVACDIGLTHLVRAH